MKFDKHKGQRIKRYFQGVTNFSGQWWLCKSKIWVDELPHPLNEDAATIAPCKTYRACIRHIRKHPELKGEPMFVSKYHNCNIYAKPRNGK